MNFGIIYEFVDIRSGLSAYVGKSFSLYGFETALVAAHRRHLVYAKPSAFDAELRNDSTRFSVHILDRLTDSTGVLLQSRLKRLEKTRVRMRQPRYKCVRFAGCGE